MSEILIRFIRGTAWDSRLIEYRTRFWCSHTEAVTSESSNLTCGAMLRGGVKYRDFTDKAYKHVSRWEIWHIPCTDTQNGIFWAFLHSQIGKPYDWKAIFAFGLGEHDWNNMNSWFCSEFMIAAGVSAGLWTYTADVHADRLAPSDAYLLFTTIPGAHL